MKKIFALFAAVLAVPFAVHAVETKSWVQNEQSDFESGRLDHLSLRSDGRLMLAPIFKEIYDSGTPYLWALTADAKGNLYAGGGGPSASSAKIFAIDPSGKARTLAEVPGLEVHALALNGAGDLYAATAPDGKVYRVGQNGKADVFYDPKEKYIWAMVFDPKGNLFIATGDQGQIHRVTPDGKGSVFFKTEETHARSLTMDAAGNLIVGTEPGGLVLRVSPSGDGFVLYQAPKREITAVLTSPEGAVFAAAVGNRGGAATGPPLSSSAIQATVQAVLSNPGAPGAPRPQTPVIPGLPPAPREASVSGGSELYRIDRDGYPRKIWSSAQDIVYAIALDQNGRPVIGTGNRGIIYRVDSETTSTQLINATPTQVTALAAGPGGRLFAATGNIGKIYQIGPGIEQSGTFESEAFDAGSFAYWGHLDWRGDAAGGQLTVETRSGNLDRPQKNWSPWAPVNTGAGARVTSPSARFLQYRVTFRAAADAKPPELHQMDIAYMPKNVAPELTDIEIAPANYKFAAPALLTAASPANITLPAMGGKRKPGSPVSLDTSSDTMQYAKGWIGARWAANDPNEDTLIYKLEIRGAREQDWKLIKDKIAERRYSWDSAGYADGEYILRVTASDQKSNPPQQALSSQMVSERFLIDNSAPQILNLKAARSGQQADLSWTAKDASSILSKAEYSVDGGEWTLVQPTTRLSDSQTHEYNLKLDKLEAGEHTIAVRVTDEFDNTLVDKTVVR